MQRRLSLRIAAVVFAVCRCAAAAPADPAAPDSSGLFAEIGRIESELSSITGLRFKHPVSYAVIGRDQFRRYLEDRIRESAKPASLRAEEIALKMFGLIPADFDLRKTAVDLLTEQAAAFYDYRRKKLYILAGGTGVEQRTALAHELAHALADQHFRLEKFIREGARGDDGETARLAVMEGQASWLMSAYLSRQAGGPAEVPEAVLKAMANGIEDNPSQYPVFSNAPLYIRESLVFPYTEGLLFQNAIFVNDGRLAFREVFERPPVSTRQILHPGRYLAREAPAFPSLPEMAGRKRFRTLAQGTVGEIDLRVLLTQYGDKAGAEAAAAHLRGSVYSLLEHKREKYPLLAFASEWDSGEAASGFLRLYQRALALKWKQANFTERTESGAAGRGDTGYFRLWRDRATVNVIEGGQSPLH